MNTKNAGIKIMCKLDTHALQTIDPFSNCIWEFWFFATLTVT